MTKYTLTAQPRTLVGRQVKRLRQQDLIPANVFGHAIPSVSVQIPAKDFQKAYATAGESTLVYLQIVGEKQDRPVLIHAATPHPVTGRILHVELHQVNLKEKVTAPVKVQLVGESLAVKDGQGILVQQLAELEIEALPTDMPEHLAVDITGLTAVDMAIMVKDLKVDGKLTIEADPEMIIAKIEPLAKEEVVAVPVTTEAPTAEVAQPEQSSDQPVEAVEPKK